MTKRERLIEWANGLDNDHLVSILIECVEELIMAETVKFYDTTKVPYWDGNGERLDGTEDNDDE